MKYCVEFFKKNHYEDGTIETHKYHQQCYFEDNDFDVYKKASDFIGDDESCTFTISEITKKEIKEV